jgi:FkbM family methyltransferase
MNRLVKIRAYDCAIDFMMDIDESFLADKAVLDWTELCGCCEPEVIYAAYRILKAGDWVIDGGANTGYTSMSFAALVGNTGKVLAFEPDPDNLAKLRTNIRLNDAYHIAICDRPLWSKIEWVQLHFNPRDPGGHSLRPLGYPVDHTKTLQATTIDALNVKPKLIKLDIEGAEISALHGAQKTICEHRPYVICEMNHGALIRFGESNNSLRQYAKKWLGYDTYLLLRIYHFPVRVPPDVEIITPVDNTNVLFATEEMIAAAFPQAYYVLPDNVVNYLQRVNA